MHLGLPLCQELSEAGQSLYREVWQVEGTGDVLTLRAVAGWSKKFFEVGGVGGEEEAKVPSEPSFRTEDLERRTGLHQQGL